MSQDKQSYKLLPQGDESLQAPYGKKQPNQALSLVSITLQEPKDKQ
ncbi:hypothetical protein [Enterococcus faecalis]